MVEVTGLNTITQVRQFAKMAFDSEEIPVEEAVAKNEGNGSDDSSNSDADPDGLPGKGANAGDKRKRQGGGTSTGGSKGKGNTGGGRGRGRGQGGKGRSQHGREVPLFLPGFDFDNVLEQARSLEHDEQLEFLTFSCAPHWAF